MSQFSGFLELHILGIKLISGSDSEIEFYFYKNFEVKIRRSFLFLNFIRKSTAFNEK